MNEQLPPQLSFLAAKRCSSSASRERRSLFASPMSFRSSPRVASITAVCERGSERQKAAGDWHAPHSLCVRVSGLMPPFGVRWHTWPERRVETYRMPDVRRQRRRKPQRRHAHARGKGHEALPHGRAAAAAAAAAAGAGAGAGRRRRGHCGRACVRRRAGPAPSKDRRTRARSASASKKRNRHSRRRAAEHCGAGV